MRALERERREAEDEASQEQERLQGELRAAEQQASQNQASLQPQKDNGAAQAEAKREAEARAAQQRDADEKSYWNLVKDVTDAEKLARQGYAFANNPFETALATTSREASKAVVGAGLNASVPIGPEKRDPTYDAVSNLLDEGRSLALGVQP